MPASLGELMVGLGVDFSGMNEGATAIESRLESMGTRLYFIGSRIGAAFSAPLAGALTAIGEFGMAFDSAMTESLAIMNNVTPQIRANMEDQARAISETTKFSSVEAAKAYYNLASAGLDASQSVAALPIVAKFAQAGMMDMAKSTDVLAGAMTGLGLKTGDATKDAEAMTRIGNVLTEVNNRSLGTVTDFSAALTRSAATMRQYNIPVEEGVAVLGAYADQNIKGADAGSKFYMVIRDLTNAAIKHKDAFTQAFGPDSIFDSTGHLRNFADIIDTITQKFSGLSDEGKRAEMAFLGLTSRSQQALLPLIGTGERIRELTTALKESGGSMDNVANNQMKSFENQLKLIQNRFDNLKSVLFESFKPALADLLIDLNGLVEKLKPIVDWVNSWTTEHKKLAIEIALFLAALGTIIVTIGGLVLVFSAVSSIVAAVGVAFTAVSVNMGAILASSVLLIEAVTVIGAAFAGWKFGEWIDSWTGASDWVQNMTMWLMGMSKAEREAAFAFQNIPKNTPGAPAMWNITPQQTLSMWSDPIAGPGLGGATTSSGTGAADRAPSKADIKAWEDWKKAITDLQSILTSSMWDGSVEGMLKLGASVKDTAVYFGISTGEVENSKKAMTELGKVLRIEAGVPLSDVIGKLKSMGDVVPEKFFTDMDTTLTKLAKIEAGAGNAANMLEQMGFRGKPHMDSLTQSIIAFSKANDMTTKIIGEMASEFTRLGREVGGTLGTMLSDIGMLATAAVTATKGADNMVTGFKQVEKGGANVVNGLMDMAMAAMQVAGAFQAATNSASMAENVFGGAMVGMQTGKELGTAIGGPVGGAIGSAIGAAVGAIAALIKGRPEWAEVGDYIGNTMGVHVSQKLAQSIVDLAKTSFNGNDQAATIASLGKIMNEAGGLTSTNMNQFVGTFRDTFVMLTTGAMTAAQATKNLDDNFQAFVKAGTDGLGFLDQKLVEIIKLNNQFGTDSKAIGDYLKGQASNVTAGFNSIVQGATSSLKDNQAEFDKLGRLAGIAFGTAMASGQSFLEAVNSIGTAIDSLSTAADQFKFTQTDAFGELKAVRAFTQANKDLVGELDGVNKMVTGLANSGLLTQKTITDLGSEATQVFKRMVDGGLSSNAALMLMAPTLQTLWQAQQTYGLKVDDSTQALIDMAVQDKIVGETHKTINDQMLDSLNKLNDTMDRFVTALIGPDGANSAFNNLGVTAGGVLRDIRTQIDGVSNRTFHYTVETDYTSQGSQNDNPYMASGGIAMGQRQVTVGDAGPEAIIPLDRLKDVVNGIGGSSDGGDMIIQLLLDGRVVTQTVLQHMPSELRRNGIFT